MFNRELSDKDREMIARIDEVRGEVASMWEGRLLWVPFLSEFESTKIENDQNLKWKSIWIMKSRVKLKTYFKCQFLVRFRNEMLRLKDELETCFAEDRIEAVQRAQREHMDDVAQMKDSFAFREKMLQDEIDMVRDKLADRNRRLDEANEKADKQIMQIRLILNKSEQGHQREMQSQEYQHENQIGWSNFRLEAFATSFLSLIRMKYFLQ